MKTFATMKQIAGVLIGGLLTLSANATITNALKVQIINGSLTDETVVRFLPSATTGFDASYDAYKVFSSSPAVPSLFTNIDPVSHLSINALPQLTQRTDVDLYAYIKTAGNYTFQAVELGSFPAGCKIMLEDKQTGTGYVFRNGASITLNLEANTLGSDSRFVLHFSPAVEAPVNTSRGGYVLRDEETASITDEASAASATFKAFAQEGDLVQDLQTNDVLPVNIEVYSIGGQLIYHYSNNNSLNVSERLQLPASGIYIVRALIGSQVQSQKLSITK